MADRRAGFYLEGPLANRPPAGRPGLMYISDEGGISIDNGQAWMPFLQGVGTGKITVSATAPTTPSVGDLWVEAPGV